jgi:hypothetical protein
MELAFHPRSELYKNRQQRMRLHRFAKKSTKWRAIIPSMYAKDVLVQRMISFRAKTRKHFRDSGTSTLLLLESIYLVHAAALLLFRMCTAAMVRPISKRQENVSLIIRQRLLALDIVTIVNNGKETITSSTRRVYDTLEATATDATAGDEWLDERLPVDFATHGSSVPVPSTNHDNRSATKSDGNVRCVVFPEVSSPGEAFMAYPSHDIAPVVASIPTGYRRKTARRSDNKK